MQARPDTYIQCEIWDENKVCSLHPRLLLSLQMHRWTIAITGSACGQELVEKVAQQIRKAGRADRVILGSPSNAKIWKMCGEALPEASRILPNSEVRTFSPGSLCHSCT